MALPLVHEPQNNMTARAWADMHATPTLRSPSSCALNHDEIMKGGGREDIEYVDNMRLFMLSRFAQKDISETQMKKTQKVFQVITFMIYAG